MVMAMVRVVVVGGLLMVVGLTVQLKWPRGLL